MALDREYKIEPPSRRCKVCDRTFDVGDEYFSAVAETGEEMRLAREDYCPACWKPDGGTYFSFWKTRVAPPDEKAHRGPRLVDLGRLLLLFAGLADSQEEDARRFRYVLALVLMRKRRLRIVESRRLAGGRGEELTLREVGSDRTHVVAGLSITDDEIRSVAGRLGEILDMPEKWDTLASGEGDVDTPPPDAPAGEGGAADA